jgi:hypothetical protein
MCPEGTARTVADSCACFPDPSLFQKKDLLGLDPAIEPREPQIEPFCDLFCPPGMQNDPNIPGCNCAAHICLDNADCLEGLVFTWDNSTQSCGCVAPVGCIDNIMCKEGYHYGRDTYTNTCGCLLLTPEIERRGPQIECDFACPTGWENDPNISECNCAAPICIDNVDCLDGLIYTWDNSTQSCGCVAPAFCPLDVDCKIGYHWGLDTYTNECTCLLLDSEIDRREPQIQCDLACPPGTEYDPNIPGCNCAVHTCIDFIDCREGLEYKWDNSTQSCGCVPVPVCLDDVMCKIGYHWGLDIYTNTCGCLLE